jgi:rRNA biogenesis protein RRP5
VDISLRSSRVDGDLDDDVPAAAGDTVQGYVVETNKKGCFVRLARNVEGRVTLKELCDGFLPDPAASFPPGRLVVGRVKGIRNAPKKAKHANNPVKFQVDLDMRESTLLDQKKQLTFDDIELDSKYNGTVTRIESYGVFVQIEKSNVSGLTHMSECSDKFIKKLGSLYDPGDLVKVLVIKKDVGSKKLGFSMKASHFEDDEDSDDDSSIDAAAAGDEEMVDMEDSKDDNGLDSDDENFGAKLASQMEEGDADPDDDVSGSESEDDSDDGIGSDSDDDSEEEETPSKVEMDTDIGFDWGARGTSIKKSSNAEEDSSDDSDSDDSDGDDGDMNKPSSHKSRKKQAQRRREEEEITRRETALADGTADENPETAGDFERLLAGNPNSSELWIRYMAFYLSLADIPSARKVADKALGRIEFREETEKLNVWTALLTLEHKYGSDDSLQKTVDKACGHCNPKQVYLRVCEILEKDASNSESVTRANNMFAKMCKKFKSKKKVWLAHLEFLLKQSRHQDAHALLKRALLSLATYKHAETMSKFAQLEFEHGSAERARTLFEGILERYPKRLDLFFVYLDKEVKFGKASSARASFGRKVEEGKLADKQMKSLFKKWFRMEEEHGSEEQQQHVKDTAKEYVQRTSN